MVYSAKNTYNELNTAYQEGDGEKLGSGVTEGIISVATTKGLGAAGNVTGLAGKVDNITDAVRELNNARKVIKQEEKAVQKISKQEQVKGRIQISTFLPVEIWMRPLGIPNKLKGIKNGNK